jgi:nucleotide-binding universal stress UspA family protein
MYSDKPVLVGYDGSEPSTLALRWALDEASRRHLGVTILHADAPDVVLSAVAIGYYQQPDDPRPVTDAGLLEHAAATAAELAPDVPVTTRIVAASSAVALLDAAPDASVVVLGSRGLDGFAELMVGSTSLQVATHATVPVVVVRVSQPVTAGPEAGRVVVGVDGSHAAQDALGFGFDEAALRGVGLTAVRAWRSPYYDTVGAKGGAIPWHVEAEVVLPAETDALRDEVAGWRNKYPEVDVRERVVHGSADQVLVDLARGAELVAVGSRGRGGFASLLFGSVGHAVLHHASCPVAVVRPVARD